MDRLPKALHDLPSMHRLERQDGLRPQINPDCGGKKWAGRLQDRQRSPVCCSRSYFDRSTLLELCPAFTYIHSSITTRDCSFPRFVDRRTGTSCFVSSSSHPDGTESFDVNAGLLRSHASRFLHSTVALHATDLEHSIHLLRDIAPSN